jgi:hypothetical protein
MEESHVNDADHTEFEQLIEEFANVFPTSISRIDSAKRHYFKYLADISMVRMRRVAHMACQQLDTFPTIHRLRDLAGVTNVERCKGCAGSDRISHIKAVTIDYFRECGQSIEFTLEAVYGHCGLKFSEYPEIRLWAKQAIAEEMEWSTLPIRFQDDQQVAHTQIEMAKLRG